MLAYRVGFPGWKIAARLGLPLEVMVKVFYDQKTGYMTTSSEDFFAAGRDRSRSENMG